MRDTQKSRANGENRTATVHSLSEARFVDLKVRRVNLVREGKPRIVLLRRGTTENPQGLLQRRVWVEKSLFVPPRAVLVGWKTRIDGKMRIGNYSIVEDCALQGEGTVESHSHIKRLLVYGSSRQLKIGTVIRG